VLVTKDTEKVKLMNAAFASVFTGKAVSQEFQSLEARGKAWRMDDLPLVKEDDEGTGPSLL